MSDSGPASASIGVSDVSGSLSDMLAFDDIVPGDEPSYQMCKTIYVAHPLGRKMAQGPVALAQCQERDITVPAAPEERVVAAFKAEWSALKASEVLANLKTQARIFGIASCGLISEGTPPDRPIKPDKLWESNISFNIWDPLLTAGSLVSSQDPNSRLFQKHGDLVVNASRYHRSRTVTVMNEEPLFIQWTTSAFGYVGRSVFQRPFFPLKSFINSMIADDLVTKKVGVFISKMEAPGSIIDRAMQTLFGLKRSILKESSNSNVISIGLKESVETLNMQNLDGPHDLARNNIIKNIATASDMPAKLLTTESYVAGFGEGTQDAMAVAQWIDRFRIEMNPEYAWMDEIVMRRAWNPDFFATVQRDYPQEYGRMSYLQAFYLWKKSFKAVWPNLIKEPPSEAAQVDDIKLKGVIAAVQVFAPLLDSKNRVRLCTWASEQFNLRETIFEGAKLDFDAEDLEDFLAKQEEQAAAAGGAPNLEQEESAKPERPFSSHDADATIAALSDYVRTRAKLGREAAGR